MVNRAQRERSDRVPGGREGKMSAEGRHFGGVIMCTFGTHRFCTRTRHTVASLPLCRVNHNMRLSAHCLRLYGFLIHLAPTHERASPGGAGLSGLDVWGWTIVD
jgi:hypothetical protein